MALNLERQLLFYGSYHHNPVNVAIHITCVPTILMTGLVLASNTPTLLPMTFGTPYLEPNLGVMAAFHYALLYVLMEPVAGGMLAPLIMGGTAYGNYLLAQYGSVVNYWAGGIHLVCWIAQFVGHGAFEGRAPALLDNLVQALFLAPFFVWFEILFALGYRPELKQRLGKAVEREIAKFNAQKAGKTNGHAKSQ